MTRPGFVITAILALAALYVLLPVMSTAFRRFRGRKTLRCPETGRGASVDLSGLSAALTSAIGSPRLCVRNCSLWPERKDCQQACLRRLQTCLDKA